MLNPFPWFNFTKNFEEKQKPKTNKLPKYFFLEKCCALDRQNWAKFEKKES